MLSRVEQIIKMKPAKVFIMAGINDIFNNIDLENTKSNYNDIVNKINAKLPDTKIYVISTLPVSQNNLNDIDKIKELNKFLSKNANNKYTFIDVFDKFSSQNGYIKEEYTVDGTHLKGNGYQILKESLLCYIN